MSHAVTELTDLQLSWDALLRTWQHLDVPEGWRAEVSDEGIVMTPPPGGPHNLVADVVHEVLVRTRPAGCGVFQTLGVAFPRLGRLYIPDLCVLPRGQVPVDDTPVVGADLLLAAEITSAGNAHHDRKAKKWAYAHGPVPLYLLIDRHDEDGPTVSLFSQPEAGSYRRVDRVPFGAKLDLPEPFDVELDTATF